MLITHHIYFLASLYFSCFWLLFFAVGENKRAMFITSVAGLVVSPFVEKIHLLDWWHPHFLFNSLIHIEDLIFGFTTAGIISAVYAILSSNYHEGGEKSPVFLFKISIIFSTIIILFSLYYIFHLHSFWASIIAMIYSTFVICIFQPKIIPTILIVGLFMVIIALPGYLLGSYISPEWIQNEYYLVYLSHITIFSIPIEELVWFFFAGVSISAFQELFN